MNMEDFEKWAEGEYEGFFSTDKTYCKYCFFDKNKPVVITFSMMGKYVNNPLESTDDIWGYSFLVNKKINVVSFCCIEKASWYLDDKLVEKIDNIVEILKIFPERLGYGGSMGGFGILAYYEKLNINRVLVINPITTLNDQKAPFENRYKVHRERLNWNFEFNDIAKCKMNGYIVYDPLFDLDKKHAKRVHGLQELKFTGVGHSLPLHLNRIGALSWLFQSFYNGLDPKELSFYFYKKVRKKREYSRYYKWLLSAENKYLTPKRKKVIELHYKFKKLKYGEAELVPKGAVNKVRDYAIVSESSDLKISYEVMKLASELRPQGSFIKKKIKFYESTLGIK